MRKQGQNKSVDNHIVREAARIATRKDNLDALSWGRIEEIGHALQDCSGPEAASALGQELLTISQANLSLSRRLGLGDESESRGHMASGMEMYGSDMYTKHVLVDGKEVERMDAVAARDELVETEYIEHVSVLVDNDEIEVEGEIERDVLVVDDEPELDPEPEEAPEPAPEASAEAECESEPAAEPKPAAESEEAPEPAPALAAEPASEPAPALAPEPAPERKPSWLERRREKRRQKEAAQFEREMTREEKIVVPRGAAETDKVEVDDALLEKVSGQGNIEDEYEIFRAADKAASAASQAQNDEAFEMPKTAKHAAVVDSEPSPISNLGAHFKEGGKADGFPMGRHAGKRGSEGYTAEELATFKLVYESRDGRMCIYEDKTGHLVSVDASKLV